MKSVESIEREFQIFAKPVGAACNLNCSYCYYLQQTDLFPDVGTKLMHPEILEEYIIQHIAATTDNTIFFTWHGGEPLLAGIDFYKKVLQIQSKFKPAGKIILNGIQTNGTLLNEEWCTFFVEANFIIGVSIDGPQELHNINRVYKDGKGTSQKVLEGIRLLLKYGIVPELLCVVNAENVKNPLGVYEYLKRLGASFITFLPLVEKEQGSVTGVSPNTVRAEDFGHFLEAVFDNWVENDIAEIKIQIFEEAARTAFNQPHTLCIFKENCGGAPIIEKNGDLYSCDHYVNSENLLGNILDKSLSYFLDREDQREFGLKKSSTLPGYCRKCEVLSMCNGECPKNRFITSPDGESGLNYLCEGYRYFFNHCKPFVEAIAEAYKKNEIH